MPLNQIQLVDDHPIMSEGLAMLLNKDPRFSVAGTAVNGPECLQQLAVEKIDLLVVDHQMPGLTGLELLKSCRKQYPAVKVVLLTMVVDRQLIEDYLEAGAKGCLQKQDRPKELLYGLAQVAAGEQYLSTTVARILAQQLQGGQQRMPISLTGAEKEVLRWIGRGLSVTEIAQQRQTSNNTVARQKQSIMDKLDIHREIKLVHYAIRHGWT
ncbi:MAG: response regulator [Salibacteraceae bacterium]